MQTTDWAEDAHDFYIKYHKNILNTQRAPKFFPNEKNVLSLLQSSPLLSQLDLSNLQDSPFAKLEEVRGWDVILRRITSDPIYSEGQFISGDGRMLTLLRRNIGGHLFPKEEESQQSSALGEDDGNIVIVSRKKWALIECVRWSKGFYDAEEIRDTIRSDLKDYYNSLDESSLVKTNADNMINRVNVNGTLLPDENTPGRYVTLSKNSGPAKPGDIIYSTRPYCSAPMGIGTISSQAGMMASAKCCFHCCRDLSNKSSTSASTVRDLSLLCEICNVSSFGYCSIQCRNRNHQQHMRECNLLKEMFLLVQTIEMEREQDGTIHEEEGGMAPFKALLVLRMALGAKNHPELWSELLELDFHRKNHLSQKPNFSADAERVAIWIANHLTISETDVILNSMPLHHGPIESVSKQSNQKIVTTLQNLFFAININAIGIGAEGVGIFPGIASMFNHSCHENTTHSWDDYTLSADNDRNEPPILHFRAIDNIAPGEECMIGYIGSLHLHRKQRILPLAQHKFFDCKCIRCEREIEEEEEKTLDVEHSNNDRITEIIKQWQECTNKLEELGCDDECGINEIQIRRKQCELADSLFPKYFVTKGLCFEELAMTLSEQSERGVKDASSDKNEILHLLEKAREQYKICRGETCVFTKRIDDFKQSLDSTKDQIETCNINETLPFNLMKIGQSEEENDEDIIELRGWIETLFEIKTYEPMSIEGLEKLSKEVHKIDFATSNYIKWANGFRVYEVGYGILTVIVCGTVNEAVISKYDVAEIIQERLDDTVQNVDVI